MDIDQELNLFLSRPSEGTVHEIVNQLIDTPQRREAARLLLRIGNPAPGSALRPIGHLRGNKQCQEQREGIVLALQALMLLAGVRALIAGLEARVARGEVNPQKAILLTEGIKLLWRDLQPFLPLVNGFLKLVAKAAIVDLQYREIINYLDNQVLAVEVAAARLGL